MTKFWGKFFDIKIKNFHSVELKKHLIVRKGILTFERSKHFFSKLKQIQKSKNRATYDVAKRTESNIRRKLKQNHVLLNARIKRF